MNEIDVGVNYKFDLGALARVGNRPPSGAVGAARPFSKLPGASREYNWTGIYIGGEGGYGFATSHADLDDRGGDALQPYTATRANGPFAGVYTGANYQIGRFVLGAEADWQGANVCATTRRWRRSAATGTLRRGPFTITTTMKHYHSVRGRLGYAFDRFLLFGTAGWAWGNPSIAYGWPAIAPFFTKAATHPPADGPPAPGSNTPSRTMSSGAWNTVTPTYGILALSTSRPELADPGSKLPINDFRAGLAYKFDGDLIFADMLGDAGK